MRYNYFEGREEVAVMKGTTGTTMKPRHTMMQAMPGKLGQMIRRTPNHNTHIITPHGKVTSGRKGRTS
jgi:hypothetical protein